MKQIKHKPFKVAKETPDGDFELDGKRFTAIELQKLKAISDYNWTTIYNHDSKNFRPEKNERVIDFNNAL